MTARPPLTALTLLFLVAATRAEAAWAPDGVALCTAAQHQDKVQAVSDGTGGAIVTWQDYRNALVPDIYVQRVDVFGNPQWTAGGVAVCTASGDQINPVITSDGAGGAIIAWRDGRTASPDIYAQRVDAAGVPQWTANGVPVCTASGLQYVPAIDTDGAGGAVIAWQDTRAGSSDDIYVQRIDLNGAAQWTADGVAACTFAGQQSEPRIIPDGSQGAIVVWRDLRNGNYDVYAQSVNFFGSPAWTPNGVPVCTDATDQYSPRLVSDGAGGAIVVWEDKRSGLTRDIYAQRLYASGSALWTTNGVAVCQAADDQTGPGIVSDGNGGAIVAWDDSRNSPDIDVYAQRIDAGGSSQWAQDGAPVCTQGSVQLESAVASDGEGGAVVVWRDNRNGSPGDVFAQRMDALGTAQWTPDGVPVSLASNGQFAPVVVVSDGGALAAWRDLRSNGSAADVYGQRVELTHGAWGHPEPVIDAAADVPGDEGGQVAVNWTASGRDRTAPRSVGSYSVWRAVDPLGAPAAPPVELLARAMDPAGAGVLRAGTDYYWELVGTQPAHGWSAYSFSTATRSDSVSADPGTEYFLVAAHDEADAFVVYASNVVSGHSVDNLAPAAPLLLAAQRVGSDVQLSWNRVGAPDLRDYTVYRATSSGVTPSPDLALVASADTMIVDVGAPATTLYYIVTATDVHENQGPPSNEASVGGATGAPGLPAIAGLSLLPNRPNPFRSGTELTIGLAEAGDVHVTVHDVAGRTLRRLGAPGQPAGWIRVPFDGRDDAGRPLPAGVYFYRVRAGGRSASGNLVVTR